MFEINLIKTRNDMAGLESRWNLLQSQNGEFNVFLSFPWISAWFEHIGKDSEPFILAGLKDGNVAGIAPFARKGNIIIAAGYPQSDFVDVLCSKADEIPFIFAVSAFLEKQDSSWRLSYIKALREDSSLFRFIKSNPATGGIVSRLSFLSCCFVADLSKGWQDYYEGLSNRLRRDCRRRDRIAEETGDVELSVYSGEEITATIISEAISINRTGRKAGSGTAFFQKPGHDVFFHALAGIDIIRKNMLIAFLRLGGKPIAYKICFINNKDVWEYNTAFSEDFSRLAPGKILTLRFLRHLAGMGFERYDFLKGGEDYKKDFAHNNYSLYTLSLFKKNFSSRIYYVLMVRMREWLRKSDFLMSLYDRFAG